MRDGVDCYAIWLPSVINYQSITVTHGYGGGLSEKGSGRGNRQDGRELLKLMPSRCSAVPLKKAESR